MYNKMPLWINNIYVYVLKHKIPIQALYVGEFNGKTAIWKSKVHAEFMASKYGIQKYINEQQ